MTGSVHRASPGAGAAHGWAVDRAYPLSSAALAILAIAFALLPPGLDFSYANSDKENFSPGLLGAVQWPLLFATGGYLLLRRYRLALGLLRWLNPLLPLLLGWFLASTLWSVAPAATANRAVRLIALAVCAWAYTLMSWQPGRFWRHARCTLGVIACASIIVALVFPEIGTHPPGDSEVGKWRGLTTNKNTLGATAALGLILWLHAWASREIPLQRALPWLAACAVALLGARSSTNLLLALLCCALVLLIQRQPLNLRGKALPIMTALLLLVVAPFYVYLIWSGSPSFTDLAAPVADLVGKDATLSGRNVLWQYLLEEIPRHPWLGLGYGAYWLGEWSLSGDAVRQLYWIPNQGHNFYLDLINETGLVGLALFSAFIASYIAALWRLAAVDRPLMALNGILLLYYLVCDITETEMMRAITMPTVLMFFASFDISRRLFEAELQSRRRAAAPLSE